MVATPTPEQLADVAWCEQQYNPRLSVADPLAILGGWASRAAAARGRLAALADLPYGPHPREVLDLFRAARPRGLVVFLHGGYWRALSKNEHSWLAEAFVARGYSVAIPNYPLCPEVSVGDIAEACRRAISHLWPMLEPGERANAIVSGHSAGGYLTAAMLATDWTARGLPAAPFGAGLSVSGVFHLPPLLNTSMNAEIRLTAETAQAFSLTARRPASPVRLVLAVGGAEPGEFHRQSALLAAGWGLPADAVRPIGTCNHFSILDQLAEPGSALFTEAMALLDAE